MNNKRSFFLICLLINLPTLCSANYQFPITELTQLANSNNIKAIKFLRDYYTMRSPYDFHKALEWNEKLDQSNTAVLKKSAELYRIKNLVKGGCEKAVNKHKSILALSSEKNRKYSWAQIAWIYASCYEDTFRNGEVTIDIIENKLGITAENNKSLNWLDTLAAGYAAKGDYNQAIHIQKKVVKINNNRSKKNRLLFLNDHLK